DIFALDPAYVARTASEDVSGFGPAGTAALLGAPVAAVLSRRAHRRDPRFAALALALPTYIVLLAAFTKYNIWICRFLLVPVVLGAPLFAALCRRNAATTAMLVLGGLTLAFALVDDDAKKLGRPARPPWPLPQVGGPEAFPAA